MPYNQEQIIKELSKLDTLQFSEKDKVIIKKILENKLTFIQINTLQSLLNCVQRVEKKAIEGIYIEAGTALGGSAALIAASFKHQRKFYLYDVFDMIPPPDERDGKKAQDTYNWFIEDLNSPTHFYSKAVAAGNMVDSVLHSIESIIGKNHNADIQCIQGMVEDSLKVDESVAFAHLDVDWYSPVYYSLDNIVPNLSMGGLIVIDDYKYWPGCRRAVRDFFSSIKNEFHFNTLHNHLIVERTNEPTKKN